MGKTARVAPWIIRRRSGNSKKSSIPPTPQAQPVVHTVNTFEGRKMRAALLAAYNYAASARKSWPHISIGILYVICYDCLVRYFCVQEKLELDKSIVLEQEFLYGVMLWVCFFPMLCVSLAGTCGVFSAAVQPMLLRLRRSRKILFHCLCKKNCLKHCLCLWPFGKFHHLRF